MPFHPSSCPAFKCSESEGDYYLGWIEKSTYVTIVCALWCLSPSWMLSECSDGDCPGSVMSSLLLTLITSCVMRLHMCCAKSQIAVLIWDSLVLELVVSVLSCLTGLFGNKRPWTVCLWLPVSGLCYLTVPVVGNFELMSVKPALATPGFLFIAVSSHVSSDLTPKILNLLTV